MTWFSALSSRGASINTYTHIRIPHMAHALTYAHSHIYIHRNRSDKSMVLKRSYRDKDGVLLL